MDEYSAPDTPDSGNSSELLTSSDKLGYQRMERKPVGHVSRQLDNEYDSNMPMKKLSQPEKLETTFPATLPDKPDGVDYHKPGDSVMDVVYAKADQVHDGLKDLYEDNKTIVWNAVYLVLLLGYLAYLIYACFYDFDDAMIILIITGIVLALFIYVTLRDKYGDKVYKGCCLPFSNRVEDKWDCIKWPLYIFLVLAIAVALFFLTKDHPEQLISAAGLMCLVLFTFVFSKHPRQVQWRPVIWGLILQFIMGLVILRTKLGFHIFDFLGNLVSAFLTYTDAGSIFVFGANYKDHFFAFKVLPVVIYFSSVIAVFYYMGIMQVVIRKIALLMQSTMKTSASESLNAAGNIFVGQTEAPLMIRPYIGRMTKSELHAVMTGGFATIAGSVLGAYISFGISASHLLSASVMSAPAALAIAKLFYPETEESQTVTADQMKLPKGQERNVIEAASFGASTAVPLVLNIAANLIAFLALLALCNGILGYFGGLVGYPQLSFELICSYVFMPLAFMMGTDWDDCQIVAELIGTKTFINEFVAYERLSEYIDNRATGLGPTISLRSEVIATYALCGFANVGSIGIQLGGLTPMAPERKGDLADVAIRALVAGTVACFMTACIAGVLYVPETIAFNNATIAVTTMSPAL